MSDDDKELDMKPIRLAPTISNEVPTMRPKKDGLYVSVKYYFKLESRVRELEADKKLLEDDIKLIELYLKNARNDREILRIKVRELEAERDLAINEIGNLGRKLGESVAKVEALDAERDRLKAEIDRQKRLDLSGECDRLRAHHAALVEAAQFKRNVIIHDEYGFDGKWVAIPNEDFEELKVALSTHEAEDELPPRNT